MDLSPSFTLDRLTFSDTALRRGIDNVPNAGEIANLQRLCITLLEPAQQMLGVSLHINSGFRSPSLNQVVHGATHSAHMDGRAADFVTTLDLRGVFDTLRDSDLPYDQIIFECKAWIHLAVAPFGSDSRHQALLASGTPGNWIYSEVK